VIDKLIYKFLDWIDSWTSWIDDMFFKDEKRKKDEHDPEFLDDIDEDK
jgi:hypothetical protein|tara:strand:+ start:78 stop:221 length:144 start_codon:yes stop_codon:yes gene_type:complete